MLVELSVRNLALIEDARVELKPGFCAWTGETGAGKSLLLTAIGLVLGQKASADLVRSGRSEARASAVFETRDASILAEIEAALGEPIEDGAIVITRRINTAGRSTAHVNGLPVPNATLRAIGARLLDVHGQHETRALADPERQRDWLDARGGLGSLRARYVEARQRHLSIRQRREALRQSLERRDRERETLRFEVAELGAADPREGEYAELVREAHRLANAGRLRAAIAAGYQRLYEADGSAQELIERVARELRGVSDEFPELRALAEDLERVAEETRDAAYQLRSLDRAWNDDPGRLDEMENRLALLRKLASRFRCDPEGLSERLELARTRLAELEREEEDAMALEPPLREAWNDLRAAGAALSRARAEAAAEFAREVESHLADLALPDARLRVAVESRILEDDPGAPTPPDHGLDDVEFLFAPNPGEPARSLRKIASGGELARVTLAVKTVLADADNVPTLIFDEIDTGVGGRLGAALGRKIASLARHHQIVCVTHLPQIACHADHQWVVRKRADDGRARTTILPLDEAGRVEELALMLRGDTATEATRDEARAMLREALAPKRGDSSNRADEPGGPHPRANRLPASAPARRAPRASSASVVAAGDVPPRSASPS